MNRILRSKLCPDLRWIAFDVGVAAIACSKQLASVHLLLAISAAVLAAIFLVIHWGILNERGYSRTEAPASFPLSACSHCIAWSVGLLLAYVCGRVG